MPYPCQMGTSCVICVSAALTLIPVSSTTSDVTSDKDCSEYPKCRRVCSASYASLLFFRCRLLTVIWHADHLRAVAAFSVGNSF